MLLKTPSQGGKAPSRLQLHTSQGQLEPPRHPAPPTARGGCGDGAAPAPPHPTGVPAGNTRPTRGPAVPRGRAAPPERSRGAAAAPGPSAEAPCGSPSRQRQSQAAAQHRVRAAISRSYGAGSAGRPPLSPPRGGAPLPGFNPPRSGRSAVRTASLSRVPAGRHRGRGGSARSVRRS